ncbi:MAG: hypothetical protein PUP93_01045 [Rhizonema sp. NSF051]|nr:hypothetical protein [Rhizonema sp. NSF051]
MSTQVIQAKPATNTFSDFIRFWLDVKAITGFSKGVSITTRDGFTYRYDKNPKVLK